MLMYGGELEKQPKFLRKKEKLQSEGGVLKLIKGASWEKAKRASLDRRKETGNLHPNLPGATGENRRAWGRTESRQSESTKTTGI